MTKRRHLVKSKKHVGTGVAILPVTTRSKAGPADDGVRSPSRWRTLVARVRGWFPDREFFMRSNGHVRFIRVSSQLQMRVVGAITGAVLLWVLMLGWMIVSQAIDLYDQASLLEREAAVATAESRVAQYRSGLGNVANDLAKRQDFIERSVQGAIGPLPKATRSGTVSDSSEEAGKTVRKVSMALPEATGLAKVEARQLAFIEAMTRYADARSARAESAIRRLGLNPQTVTDYISSGFGYRVDPFTGGGAFHAGLDFRGPIGAPILAAAAGTVSFTGVKQGYGNCVEISHGNGLLTRYAHMSQIAVRIGEVVRPGRKIGAIGSTGR